MDWLPRLKQRKLVQWLVAYCAASWALLQVLDFLTTQFEWPPFILRTLVIVTAVGAVAVFVVAWFHGERGEQRVPPLEIALLIALLILGGVGAFAFRGEPKRPDKVAIVSERDVERSSLAVLPFRNLSGDPAQDFFSDGFTEELSSALAAVEGLRVVAPSAFEFTGKRPQMC